MLKLLSLNIEGDNHYDLIFPFLEKEKPDVFCFQELFKCDIPLIEEKTSSTCVFVPMWKVTKENTARFSLKGEMGIGIFSSLEYPAVSLATYAGYSASLPEASEVAPDAVPRKILCVDVIKDGKTYRVVTTHFTWTPNGGVTPVQQKDLQSLLSVLEPLGEFVMCGDFNAPRGKEIFDILAKRYTDNIPKEVTTTINNALHKVPNLEPLVVDALFTTSEYKASDVQVILGVSDHCAVMGNISQLTKTSHS
jgi:exonuclease III